MNSVWSKENEIRVDCTQHCPFQMISKKAYKQKVFFVVVGKVYGHVMDDISMLH